jgi:hypothetical protein
MPCPTSDLSSGRLAGGPSVLQILVLSAAALAAGPLPADDVHLVNGEVFAGVVAVETETHVRVKVAGGEMRLPKAQVARVVQAESPYERYLALRPVVEANPAATAADWLDLARLALAAGLNGATRETALAAAGLDPDLPGLSPVLARCGYVRLEGKGEWIPKAEQMRREGFVLHDGAWVRRETLEAELAAMERRAQALRAAREHEARQREVDLREIRPRAAVPATQVNVFVAPMIYSLPLPWFIVPSIPGEPRPPLAPPRRPAGGGPIMDLLERQPGSLIPGHLSLSAPASGDAP